MKVNKRIVLIVAFLFSMGKVWSQIPKYIPQDSLVGWWPFNGNANDESGKFKNGMVLNASISNDRYGNTNNSYLIDGVNCSSPKGIKIPVKLNQSQDYSISMWVKTTDSTKENQCLLNSEPHQFLGLSYNYIGRGNYLTGALGNGTWINAGPSGNLNWKISNMPKWNHIVLLKNSNELKIYINGISAGKIGFSSSVNSGMIDYLVLGGISINGGVNCYEVFKGNIDDVAIWRREINPTEITTIYNSKNCTLKITKEPSNFGLKSGDASFTVRTNDTSSNFQWQTNQGTGWVNLNNAGQYENTLNDSIIIRNVTSSNNGQLFRCITSSACGKDTSTEAKLIIWGVDIKSTQHSFIKISPNPTSEIINIVNYSQISSLEYQVYSTQGEILMQGTGSDKINIANLPNGVYIFYVNKIAFRIVKN